jgi:prevent-host-death family protein
MSRLQLAEDVKPLSEFRSGLASCIRQVRRTKRPVVITHHGESAAVLLDISHYETLMDRIETLQDIRTGEQQISEGKGIPHDRALEQALKRVRA